MIGYSQLFAPGIVRSGSCAISIVCCPSSSDRPIWTFSFNRYQYRYAHHNEYRYRYEENNFTDTDTDQKKKKFIDTDAKTDMKNH